MTKGMLPLSELKKSLAFQVFQNGAEVKAQEMPWGFFHDSRKVPGSDGVFVCLKGDRVDGHSFIESVVQQKVRWIVAEKDESQRYKEVFFAVTESPLEFYRWASHLWRKKFTIPVIAVGGSVGKTTTKDLLTSCLRGKWNVLATTGSQNGFVGIPQTLFELNQNHQAAVIEIGIDEPGAMSRHVDIVVPTHCILTAISEEHMEFFKTLDVVAREEWILCEQSASKYGARVFANSEDSWMKRFAENTPVHWVTRSNSALPQNVHGDHNVMNFSLAVALAKDVGLSEEEISQGLATYAGSQGRSQIKQIAGRTVICDYYNASPASMRAAFVLAEKEAKVAGKNLAFALADMHELGDNEERYHRELAQAIPAGAKVFLKGKRMLWLADEFKIQGRSAYHSDQYADLAKKILKETDSGDVILVKGSRGQKMELLIEELEKSQ